MTPDELVARRDAAERRRDDALRAWREADEAFKVADLAFWNAVVEGATFKVGDTTST